MNEPDAYGDAGLYLEIDYDVGRWLRLPRGDADLAQRWARDAASAWARDCGRDSDERWVEVLGLMLEAMAGQYYEEEPDALFAHVLTPQDQARDPQLVALRTLPADEELADFVDRLVSTDASDSVEQPTCQWVELDANARAAVIVSHLRDEDAAIQTDLRVVWQLHDNVLAALVASSPDIGRVLQTRDDLIELAGHVQIHLVEGLR